MEVRFPGFFELQVNGFFGVDFNTPTLTPEDIARATTALRATGVTRYLPTLITSSFANFAAAARTLAADKSPAIAGIHMEGPYIAVAAKGAHPVAHVRPAALDDFERRQEAAGGRIRLVTLAPEVPGALALTETLVARGICVSIGHTAASPAQIRDGIKAGASLSTHLGNGTPSDLPKFPNLIWEQLAADGLHASFIVDGHHLPDSVVKSMIRAKTLARSILVTDAIAAAGLAPGAYRLGDIDIQLAESGRVTLRGNDRLAGAALRLDVAVGNTVRATGLSLEEIWPLASTNPARLMGEQPIGTVTADWDGVASRLTIKNVA